MLTSCTGTQASNDNSFVTSFGGSGMALNAISIMRDGINNPAPSSDGPLKKWFLS